MDPNKFKLTRVANNENSPCKPEKSTKLTSPTCKRIDIGGYTYVKVAKNEIQRMKNIVRAKKEEVPRSGYLGAEAATSGQLLTAVTVAKASTASVGKFQSKLPKEKEARGIGVKELIPGAKRKASHISNQPEKEANLDLIKSVLNKKPKIDIEKAISLQKHDERLERAANEETGKKSKKNKKGGGKGSRKAVGKKPKGGRGQRAPGKKAAIAAHIVEDIHASKEKKTRYLLRLVPIEVVCKANHKDIVSACGQLCDKYFLKEHSTFSIAYKKQSNNDVHREELLKDLADLIKAKNIKNTVDLKHAKKSLIVQVVKGLCCLSVVENYMEMKKYNLSELAENKADYIARDQEQKVENTEKSDSTKDHDISTD